VRAREDNRDCNPLINRLPAEVISRRRHAAEADAGDGADVTADRKTVFAMKPDQRLKWLERALKHAAEGEMGTNDVYDIVSSSRFAEGVQPKVGLKMSRAVREQLGLFSAKQQRFLSSEAVIFVKFGALDSQEESARAAKAAKAKKVENKEPGDSTMAEEMLARCRAFMREKAQERGELPAALGESQTAGASPEQTANGTGIHASKEASSEALASPEQTPQVSKSAAVDNEKAARDKAQRERSRSRDKVPADKKKGSAAKKKSSAKDADSSGSSSTESSSARKPKKARRRSSSRKKSSSKAETPKDSKKRRRSSSSSSPSRDAKKKRQKGSKQKSSSSSSSSSSSDSSSSSKAARKKGSKRQKQRRRSSSSGEASKARAGKRKKA